MCLAIFAVVATSDLALVFEGDGPKTYSLKGIRGREEIPDLTVISFRRLRAHLPVDASTKCPTRVRETKEPLPSEREARS